MTVKHRQIYFMSGFDPRGVSHYYRLYRDQAMQQQKAGGLCLSVGPLQRNLDHFVSHWEIRDLSINDMASGTAKHEAKEHANGDAIEWTTISTYHFLHWDDIVRKHWLRGDLTVALNYLHTFWVYLSTGTLSQIARLAWPPFITAIAPLIMLLMVLIFGLASISWVSPTVPNAWLIISIRGILVLVFLVFTHKIIQQLNLRYKIFWLLRIYYFAAQQAHERVTELAQRLDYFARYIVEHAEPTTDEILIVGHSIGSIMVTDLIGRILQQHANFCASGMPRLSLMTLGECIPIVSLIPSAKRYRDNLVRIRDCQQLEWIDFTAPTDGICFALTDPLSASGLKQSQPNHPKPKLLSPRYAQLFTAHTYSSIRRNWYRNHFQYLMAGEVLGTYDYFAITAGKLTLRQRFIDIPSVTGYKTPVPLL